jgi:hypothetical protein
MAIFFLTQDQLNRNTERIEALGALVSDEHGQENVRFCFDLELRKYWIAIPCADDVNDASPLSLAIYNDLKLSQYILEEDHSSSRDRRYFVLTQLGRMAAAKHH